MVFGVNVSIPMLFIILFIGLFLVFSPILLVEAVTQDLPETPRTILRVVFSFVVMPVVVSYLHYKKALSFAGGSLLYWAYLGVYALMGILLYSRLFSGDVTLDSVTGVVVLTIVVAAMVWWAFKTRKLFAAHQVGLYEAEREDDIARQVEAIRRANHD